VEPYAQGPIQVLFLLVDHFELFYGKVYPEGQLELVEQWRNRYPETVQGFKDCEARALNIPGSISERKRAI
jgi:hypothetical protein